VRAGERALARRGGGRRQDAEGHRRAHHTCRSTPSARRPRGLSS
jgi:hypothetical protein